jgi:two-component system, cell cycle response regulator DivK
MSKTILIVEDNDLNMKLFHDLLEAHGYNTIQTKDGIEALKLTRQHRPDLILMDIQLPEISGLEVTKWIKEDDDLKSIPVIAVTAFAMKGDEEKMREGGCEAYLAKPISVTHFTRPCGRSCNKHRCRRTRRDHLPDGMTERFPLGLRAGPHDSGAHPHSALREPARRGAGRNYLILDSLKATCLRTTGSYFFSSIFSVLARGFFLVT